MREAQSEGTRRAWVGLWAVPGIGPKAIEAIERSVGCATVLSAPISEWLGAVPLSAQARERLLSARSIADLADRTFERSQASGVQIAFRDSPEYPERLAEVEDAPPLLFYLGSPSGPRRRLAMVGTRHPEPSFLELASAFAEQIALAGVGVVSGAAEGIDRACHVGAINGQGETWAFLGSALDQLDPAPKRLLPMVLDRGGVFFSELPPGVRADRTTFPRRNRLISGASDAVLVLRAGARSGALYTSGYARLQGRPVLAMPGDPRNEKAEGCNRLIRDQGARLCLEPADALKVVGASGHLSSGPSPVGEKPDLDTLSAQARVAYAALVRIPLDFEDLLARTRLASGSLTSALCELELAGLIVQRPGRRYEKI